MDILTAEGTLIHQQLCVYANNTMLQQWFLRCAGFITDRKKRLLVQGEHQEFHHQVAMVIDTRAQRERTLPSTCHEKIALVNHAKFMLANAEAEAEAARVKVELSRSALTDASDMNLTQVLAAVVPATAEKISMPLQSWRSWWPLGIFG